MTVSHQCKQSAYPDDHSSQYRRNRYRQRVTLLRDQARQVLQMQKALTQMNIQLANVIADVVGEAGLKIAITAAAHQLKMTNRCFLRARQTPGRL